MQLLAKLVTILFYISTALNSLVYLGTVVALLKQYVSFLAYILWILVVPLLSPAFIALPWFSAWVDNTAVNTNLILLWASWYILLGIRLVLSKWAPIK